MSTTAVADEAKTAYGATGPGPKQPSGKTTGMVSPPPAAASAAATPGALLILFLFRKRNTPAAPQPQTKTSALSPMMTDTQH